MIKKIVIIGAGALGREVKWLIERINKEYEMKTGEPEWNIEGFIDDGDVKSYISGLPVLGDTEVLKQWDKPIFAVCAIGCAEIRKRVMEKIMLNSNIGFPNLIDPSVIMPEEIVMGKGNIICPGNILSVDIMIEDFMILNWDCTVGHDARIKSYVTVYPGVNISGGVKIGGCSEIGTGSHIIQGINISSNVTVGAGAVVIRDIRDGCVAVGNPAKIIKEKNKQIVSQERTI